MSRPVTITSEPMASDADTERVEEGLSLFNVARTGQDYWRHVKLFVRDEKGLIRGGLLGHIWGGWLHITDLWLEEALRGGGLGRELMETAEQEARDEGCRYVHLDSHSFQAPEFYKKIGYEEFGRLKDSPIGHEQVFLWKRL
jgi:GNAT superfamily N-acetyltransferase